MAEKTFGLKKLFSTSKKDCCSIEIEEVNNNENDCCDADATEQKNTKQKKETK